LINDSNINSLKYYTPGIESKKHNAGEKQKRGLAGSASHGAVESTANNRQRQQNKVASERKKMLARFRNEKTKPSQARALSVET
jgi:hypothetical protein